MSDDNDDKLPKSEAQWRTKLSPIQFQVLREKATERAFTGPLWDHHGLGTYYCAGCNSKLFVSDTKFDSGCGWPSFFEATPGAVNEHADSTFGMRRVEITCKKCGGHLGHVFPDGPPPTGLRYCINSASLVFKDGVDAE